MKEVNEVKTLKAHLSINVTDIEQSVEFYKKLFGAEPIKFFKAGDNLLPTRAGGYGYAKFDLENPSLNFVMNEVPFSVGGSLSHLGIQVTSTDDVMAVRQRWIDSGLVTKDEMEVACCYAKQDKTWARDPDGNEWEVFTVLEDIAPEEATSCGCSTSVGDYVDKVKEAVSCCTPGAKASENNPSNATCCQPN